MSWLPHLPVTGERDTTENFQRIAGQIIVGKGSPQGVVGAPVGVMFLRTDGSAKTTLYVKESAVSPTDPNGWVAK
jgi:hypothetical protein